MAQSKPSALDQVKAIAQHMGILPSPIKITAPVPPSQVMQPLGTMSPQQPVAQAPDYQALITQAYQKYGATPDLMNQVPAMAKQIQKNPYLYPYYPAIPIAETSGGKSVTYPGNYFNWGASIHPYPLQGYDSGYITDRVGYRLSTDPVYANFRANPSLETLQPHFAPPGSNPNWAGNMQAAINFFPPAGH